jgi:hypothetical protein
MDCVNGGLFHDENNGSPGKRTTTNAFSGIVCGIRFSGFIILVPMLIARRLLFPAGLIAASFLMQACTPRPPALETKPEEAPVKTETAVTPRAAELPSKSAPEKQNLAPKAKADTPYRYNEVDSASMGNEIVLTREKLLMEDENAGKDTSADLTATGEGGSTRYKITQGYRIQAYATTNFKDAEKKKEDLLSVIDDPIYVVYDPPYYKIRAGNFEKEEQAKDLKKVLEEMGNDAWVVQSKVRLRIDEGTGKKKRQ